MHPDDIDYKQLESNLGSAVPISTVKLYIENVSPFRIEEGSRDHYLNGCIEELYLQCEAAIQEKVDTIAKMKEHVTKLDELAEMTEMMGDEAGGGPTEIVDDEGRTVKVKPKKTKMCKTLLETGRCNGIKDKSCKFAHNAIELSLIPVSTKIRNLNAVITAQKHKLVYNKVLDSWVPAGKQDIREGKFQLLYSLFLDTVFVPYREKTAYKEEDDKDEEEKPKSIFARENIFRKPFEEKD